MQKQNGLLLKIHAMMIVAYSKNEIFASVGSQTTARVTRGQESSDL